MTRSLVVCLLAALVALPSLAQFVVTPEKAVTTPLSGPSDRVSGYAGNDVVDVASSGEILLVVWSERRSAVTTDIIAARFSGAGELLDRENILVATTGANESSPRVIWDGARFLVMWSAHDRETVTTRAAHVDVTGRVLQPNGVDVTTGRLWSLISTGSSVMIAMQRPVAAGTIPRIGIGTVSPALVYANIADISEAVSPQLALHGQGAIATWLQFNATSGLFAVEFQRLDRSGIRVGGVQPLGDLGTFKGTTSIAAGTSGSSALIVAAGDDAIRAVRMHDDGSTRLVTGLTPTLGQIVVTDVGGPGLQILATVNGILTLYRFDGDDALASTTRPASLALWGRIAEHGEQSFLTFVHIPAPGAGNVYGGFLPLSDPTETSRSVESQQAPALATDGSSVLVVWTEDRGVMYDAIVGRRVDRTGAPAGAPFVVSDGTYPTERPVVTFNGTDYVAFWQEMRFPGDQLWTSLYSRRIGTSGTPADVVQISSSAYFDAEPAIATDGRNILVTWTDGPFFRPELRASILAPNRYITPPSVAMPAGLFSPAAAWNGQSFLVVAEGEGSSLKSIVVSREGQPGSSGDVTIPPAGTIDSEPALAWSGTTHLLVYQRGETIHGTYVNRDGSRASADFQIAASGSAPDVAWDGTSFVVTWERGGDYRDVVVARIGAGAPLAIAADPAINESAPALLPLGNGRTLIAYQRMFDAVQRVVTRVLGPPGRQRTVRH